MTTTISVRPPVRYEGTADQFRINLTAFVGAVQLGWIRGGRHWDIERGDYWAVEAELGHHVKQMVYPTHAEIIEAAKRYIETAWESLWKDYHKQPPNKKS